MRIISIYLAGGMGNFGKDNFEESNKWRTYCKNTLENFEGNYQADVINPNSYFNFVDNPPKYSSQKEVMELDVNKVRNSNLVICNFNDPKSLGTMAELAIAYERRTPVIGLNEDYNEQLHPWEIGFCTRIFDNIDEMLDYVEDFYLT